MNEWGWVVGFFVAGFAGGTLFGVLLTIFRMRLDLRNGIEEAFYEGTMYGSKLPKVPKDYDGEYSPLGGPK